VLPGMSIPRSSSRDSTYVKWYDATQSSPTVGFRRGAGGKVSFAGKTRWNYSNLLRGAAVAPSPASQGWAGE